MSVELAHQPYDADWLLWQLADSAFPTGGFAHSNGLEAAWQLGEIPNASALAQWLEASLCQFGHGPLPFMTAAHQKPQTFEELDDLCDSFLTNHVANRASRLQGKALHASVQRVFGAEGARTALSAPAINADSRGQGCPRSVGFDASNSCCHLAPVFGVVSRSLDLELKTGARLFVFWHLRGAVAAAVRLGIVGSLEAQALLYRTAQRAETLLDQFVTLDLSEVAQTAPLLEIWQGAQDRLYSRLFQS